MPHRILFVLTSTDTMGETGEPTGLWLEEFTVPYFAVYDAGYEIDVVSTAGGGVPIDPRSLSGESDEIAENQRYRSGAALQKILQWTRSVGEIRFEDYCAVFLPGGHGTMWDLPRSLPLARGIADLFTLGRIVAAVCHGPAGLLGARLPDGSPLVGGRWVAAFTSEEESAVGLKDKVPFLLDEALVAAGARLVKGEPFAPTAVAHGNLITGQNPQSARLTAGLLVAALRGQGAAKPLRAAV
jgi:putative intracellular protease/amidase